MATAHPFGAFVGCRFKRIGCVRRIKVNAKKLYYLLSVLSNIDETADILK